MKHNLDSCLITSVIKPEKLMTPTPCLVNFQHGNLSKDVVDKMDCNVYMEPPNKILKLKKNSEEFKGIITKTTACNTFLVIRNKKDNTAKLVDVDMCWPAKVVKKQVMDTTLIESDKVENYKKIVNLNKTFGSKKTKRMTDLSVRMSAGHVNEADMKDTAKNIDVKETELETGDGEESVLGILPPCNRNADTVEDVYHYTDIISDKLLNTLEGAAEFLLQHPPTPIEKKTSFFLYKMFYSMDDNPPLLKVKLLLYANSLLTFVNMKAIELKSKQATKTICTSTLVSKKIMDDFTHLVQNNRLRPSQLKDKAICVIIILVLLISDYTLDFETLSSCIKGCMQRKLLQLIKTVGVTPKPGQNKIYKLEVPLPKLPAPRMPKKQKN